MRTDLAKSLSTSMGLRTLNEFVQATSRLRIGHRQLSTVPPVVVLDGIWMTQLSAKDVKRVDQRGRKRPVKRKKQRVVLVALGVWPRTGHCRVLDWELADGESQDDWDQLLARLIQRQLWPTRGLSLFIHDGGSGLKASLKRWYWEVPSQRCIFHKLRNVWKAIVVPEEYTPQERRALKCQLIRQAAAVPQAPDLGQAKALLADFQEMWGETQPGAVDTLFRDQDDTLRFYTYLEANPNWKPEALRTTSYLERINRKLRRVFREAGAYHSPEGFNAAVERVLRPLLVL
jgi:transposase-like protein